MPPSPSASCVGQPGRLGDCDPPQALGQLLERRRARKHRGDEPMLRSGDVTAADPRQQTGAHDAGLAGSRSADDQHEPAPEVVAAGGRRSRRSRSSRPKKSAASASSNARRPLYGLRGCPVGGELTAGERRHEQSARTQPSAVDRPSTCHVQGRRRPRSGRSSGRCTASTRRPRTSTARSCTSSPADAAGSSRAEGEVGEVGFPASS